MKVKSDCPYGNLLEQYLYQEFPNVATPSQKELLEILTNVILGTKEIRYGSLPIPERLVVLRKTISTAIASGSPIPMLALWGSIKADFSHNLDIAEVFAIKRLVDVKNQITAVYKPGVDMIIRVEDTSGLSLFSTEPNQDKISKNSFMYVNDLVDLFKILNNDNTIIPVKESDMANSNLFADVAKDYYTLFLQYLLDTEKFIKDDPERAMQTASYKKLYDIGWKGYISYEQRMFYLNQYAKMYDGNYMRMLERLSLYFAGALTRHNLHMLGNKPEWGNNYIQVSFIQPVSGLPEGYNYKYIYYRTLNLSHARTHLAPWKAKGYLLINGNEITPEIVSYNSDNLDTVGELIPSITYVSDENSIVPVSTDYKLL